MHPEIHDDLVKAVLERKHYVEFSVHGLSHWQRVERNGLYLAERETGDKVVVSLFALFHDSQRINDFDDPNHGERGAKLVMEFYQSGKLPIGEMQLRVLCEACCGHTEIIFHEEPTIKACWDADRLDLTRIGVLPDPELLNTVSAKKIASTMDYAEIETFQWCR